MRIGVVSDTHEPLTAWGSPTELLEALKGVDLILHCADLEVLGVLDHNISIPMLPHHIVWGRNSLQ